MSTRRRKDAPAPLSQRELDIPKALAPVLEGTRTQAEAARLLDLTPRHMRRLVARLRAGGNSLPGHTTGDVTNGTRIRDAALSMSYGMAGKQAGFKSSNSSVNPYPCAIRVSDEWHKDKGDGRRMKVRGGPTRAGRGSRRT